MEPEQEIERPTRLGGPYESVRASPGPLRAFGARFAEQLQARRERHATLDLGLAAIDHDIEIGGWIMASALAYRVFLILLPLSLVAVGGLGIVSHVESESPASVADAIGLAGLASSSVASAADSPARWYALLIGTPLVFWETRTLLRALSSAHRLVWGDLRRGAPPVTVRATLRLLAVVVAFLVLSAIASWARASSFGAGLVVTVIEVVPFAALWLLFSDSLSHSDAPRRALLPGAILIAIGLGMIQLLTAYWLWDEASNKHGTYGSLGLAAALLLGLNLVSRLIVMAAVLNATLWRRRANG